MTTPFCTSAFDLPSNNRAALSAIVWSAPCADKIDKLEPTMNVPNAMANRNRFMVATYEIAPRKASAFDRRCSRSSNYAQAKAPLRLISKRQGKPTATDRIVECLVAALRHRH